MNLNEYSISEGTHNGKNVIWLEFPNIEKLKAAFKKKFPKGKWSASERCWYLPDNDFIRSELGLQQALIGKNVIAHLHANNQDAFMAFVAQLKLKAYSPHTIKVYSNEFAQFLFLLKSNHADKLSPEKLTAYFLYCVEHLQLSESHLNSRINAVKFYYEQVLHRSKMFIDIPRPKKPIKLPKTLNQEEIRRLLSVSVNDKHKLILQFAYGMGLRVSEIVNLKIADIDSVNMQVLIESGKGKKDRMVNLPKSLLKELRNYYKAYRPETYLFEGQYGNQYTARSAQLVFKSAMKKARIRKKVGIHGLRHSYATHLLEAGTDIVFIQKLLGHKDIKTTLGYTHISQKQIKNVNSPLDKL
ncbi:MAG: tyrosine-type recombinase/integrase [Bacteroidetes bacterium]|nr:tyrosine-type recombinase/integrase [Bacteroidota bacterium]